MGISTLKKGTDKKQATVVLDYDAAADAKSRISLRGAKTKYFHVTALSNGSYLLEPRVLVAPEAIPARTLRMLDKSVASLKKGKASTPTTAQNGAEMKFYQQGLDWKPKTISKNGGWLDKFEEGGEIVKDNE